MNADNKILQNLTEFCKTWASSVYIALTLQNWVSDEYMWGKFENGIKWLT